MASGPKQAAQADESTRRRILDSAAAVLMDGGFVTARLMSAIARGAGLSRPTVYRYFTDVDSVRAALIRREMDKFLAALRPSLERTEWSAVYFTELIAFIVEYGRRNPLLESGLKHTPEMILPFFTTQAHVSIGYVEDVLRPVLKEQKEAGRIPVDVDVDTGLEFLARIALSLVFTTSGLDVDDPLALRRYIADSIKLTASLR